VSSAENNSDDRDICGAATLSRTGIDDVGAKELIKNT
jgi:hypothetical protein